MKKWYPSKHLVHTVTTNILLLCLETIIGKYQMTVTGDCLHNMRKLNVILNYTCWCRSYLSEAYMRSQYITLIFHHCVVRKL